MAYLGSSPNIALHKKLGPLTFNGVTTSFALTANGNPVFPPVAEALLISVNGVLQEPNTAYTVSGSNIVFATAPATGSTFFGVLLGERV